MYMVLFVLDDPNLLDTVLEAWETVGVSGVTIVQSSGINRRRRARMVGSTVMAGINRLLSSDEENHYTLLAVVTDEAIAESCLAAAEGVVGNLDEPNTGVFAGWPLTIAKGMPATFGKNEGQA